MIWANYRTYRFVTIISLIMFLQTPLLYMVANNYHRPYIPSHQLNVLVDSSMVDSLLLTLGSSNKEDSKISGMQPRRSVPSAEGASESDLSNQSKGPAFRPLSSPGYTFVLYSTYRYTLQTFYVIGTTSVILRQVENNRPVYRCEWIPKKSDEQEKDAITEAQLLYIPVDENQMPSLAAIVNCTFDRPVGGNNLGGILRLHISRGPSFSGPRYVAETIFEEEPGSVRSELLEEKSEANIQLPHEYAFCGPPIHCQANIAWIQQWLAYHHYISGARAHFYFYDVCIKEDLGLAGLDSWIQAGVLTIVPAAGEDAFPASWKRQVFMNDCLHRTRFVSRWTFFHDLEEFLYVSGNHTLDVRLDEHRDAPWMSFGSLPVATSLCDASQSAAGDAWHLERMLWREKRPECKHRDEDPWLCPNSLGRRRIVVNPRKVLLVGPHMAEIPRAGGVDFTGHVARVNHYRNALDDEEKAGLCSKNFPPGEDAGPYEFDESIASLVPEIRKFAEVLLPS